MPRASRYALSLLSDQRPTAWLKASCAAREALSVALAYSLRALDVAAPKADLALALTVSPRNSARCLRRRARSSLIRVPWGTGMPFLSANSLSWDSLQASIIMSVSVA